MITIFVFGSNLRGIHGAGAAKFAALHYGAVCGVGRGRTGNAYALPTKEDPYHSLDLLSIRRYVEEFLFYAREHPELHFQVTRVGCGRAGYASKQIAPMFYGAPSNCTLPQGWRVRAEIMVAGGPGGKLLPRVVRHP